MYLRPGGFSRSSDGWAETKEDTFTCKHCQQIVFVPARTDPNEWWCVSCMAPVCKDCKRQDWNRPPGTPCSHFERRIEAAERSGDLRRFLRG